MQQTTHKPYKTAVKTNIMETFRKQMVNGKPWVPASEDPTIVAKWEYYNKMQYLIEESNA